MSRESSCRESSAAVATWSVSLSRGMPVMAAQSAVARPAAVSSVGWAIEMPARSVVGILGLWLGQAESVPCCRRGGSSWLGWGSRMGGVRGCRLSYFSRQECEPSGICTRVSSPSDCVTWCWACPPRIGRRRASRGACGRLQ